MPKLFGVNLVPVLVASVAFFVIGFVWYGVVFESAWLAAAGITKEQAQAAGGPLWMIGGFVITVMQVLAIALVLKWRAIAAMSPAVQTAIVLWLLIALPFTLYGFFYTPAHSTTLLFIDASHLLVGWAVSAGILAAMKA